MPVASWWIAIRPGTPRPSANWRRTRWPGPLGATIADVDLGRRLDLLEVDREAVREQEQVARARCRRGSRFSQTSACFSSGSRIITTSPALAASATSSTRRPSRLGLRAAGRVGPQPDHDVDARVLQVQRVGVALRAVAEHGHGLALEHARGRRRSRRRRQTWTVAQATRTPSLSQLVALELALRVARQLARERRSPSAPCAARAARGRSRAARPRSPRRRRASTTVATTACCHSGSSRPCTPASATAGCSSSTCSTSLGRDVLAAGDDHVVGAAEHVQVARRRRGGRGRRCEASRPRPPRPGATLGPRTQITPVVVDPHLGA